MAGADGQTRTFRATLDDISSADAWIEEVGRGWGIAERTTFGARICVAEIAANVLEHGDVRAEPAKFAVTLRRHNAGLDVEIAEFRTAVRSDHRSRAPLSDAIELSHIGGLGLRLVRSYASEITYRYDGVCNRLTLQIRGRNLLKDGRFCP